MSPQSKNDSVSLLSSCGRCFFWAVAAAMFLTGTVAAEVTPIVFLAQVQSSPGSLRSEYSRIEMYTVSDPSSLERIWTSSVAEISTIRTFAEAGSLVIGQLSGVVNVIALEDQSEIATMDLTGDSWVLASYQYVTDVPYGQLGFCLQSKSQEGLKSQARISPIRAASSASLATEDARGELRLAGSTLYGHQQDYVLFKNISILPVRPADDVSGIDLEAFPVPDSLVAFRNARAWIMFAHEATFLALKSVPGGTEGKTEILVYSRLDKTWHSILIPGEGNTAMPINGWITGKIRRGDPRNDYTNNIGYPGFITDSVYLINVQSLNAFTMDLTPDGEVLWIESDTVYYRSGSSLYRAQISDTDLVDRELIVTDPRVQEIHWAFRLPNSNAGHGE